MQYFNYQYYDKTCFKNKYKEIRTGCQDIARARGCRESVSYCSPKTVVV